jgi:hypothetical protein
MLLMWRANKTPQKARSHVHAKSYFGELDAAVVVNWLNSKRKLAGDPIEKLVELNQQLPIQATEHQIETFLGRLVRRAKVAVAPVLKSAAPDYWQIEWKPVGRMDPEQGLALIRLLHMADKGLIGRVRKCAKEACGKWFYAKFEHQRFHSERCQQETFKTSPAWKKQRAEYMKRLRQEKKLRERKWMRGDKRQGKGNTR